MPEIFFREDISGEDVNAYEGVIAASREARRINQARLVMDQPEGQEKATTLALRRLSEHKVQPTYEAAGKLGEEGNGVSKRGAGPAGS